MVGDGSGPEVTPIDQDAKLSLEHLRGKFPTARRILSLLEPWGDINKRDFFGVGVGRANQECVAIIINKMPPEEVEELERYLASLINVAEKQAELKSRAYQIQIDDLAALGVSSSLKETVEYFESLLEEINIRFEKRNVTQSFVNGLIFPLRDKGMLKDKDGKAVGIASRFPLKNFTGTSLDSQLIDNILEEINKPETTHSASLQQK